MKGFIRTSLLVLILCVFSNVYASQHQVSNSVAAIQNTSQHDNAEVLNYIDNKLIDAGFPRDTREYVLTVSKERLTNVSNLSLNEKKELVNKNIYFLMTSLHVKNQQSSVLIFKQIDKANQYDKPWDYLLSTEQLNLFKSQDVFGTVSPSEMQNAVVGICPFWPVCEKPIPDKGKGKKKKGDNNNAR